jgi:hypothetical protein
MEERELFVESELFQNQVGPFLRGKAGIHPGSVIVLSRCDRRCRDEREGRNNGEKKVRTRLAILHVSPKTLHVKVV